MKKKIKHTKKRCTQFKCGFIFLDMKILKMKMKERQKHKERRYKNCYEIKSINLLNTKIRFAVQEKEIICSGNVFVTKHTNSHTHLHKLLIQEEYFSCFTKDERLKSIKSFLINKTKNRSFPT